MPHTVCITRHGNRLDFVDPEWFKTATRPYDPPLSPEGVVQARELGRRLMTENIAYIFCSPFLRSVETADAVADVLGLSIKIEAGLCEWLNPDWFPAMPELLPTEELAARFPRIDPRYVPRVPARFPESGEGALARAGETATRLTREFPVNILLVGHGASVLGATAGLLEKPPGQAGGLLPPVRYCCLVKLVRDASDRWALQLTGDTSHLSQTEAVVRFV